MSDKRRWLYQLDRRIQHWVGDGSPAVSMQQQQLLSGDWAHCQCSCLVLINVQSENTIAMPLPLCNVHANSPWEIQGLPGSLTPPKPGRRSKYSKDPFTNVSDWESPPPPPSPASSWSNPSQSQPPPPSQALSDRSSLEWASDTFLFRDGQGKLETRSVNTNIALVQLRGKS